MKILVVNCYKNEASFKKYLSYLKHHLSSILTPALPDQLKFIVRTKHSLSDLLFDVDSIKGGGGVDGTTSMGDLFDKVDFVFLDGDSLSYIPWARENDQIRLLVKNCM